LEIDILMITVNDHEDRELRNRLSINGHTQQAFQSDTSLSHYSDVGEINGQHIVLARSEMGSFSEGATYDTVKNAVQDLNPKLVICLGIAWGGDESSQNIGDLLISSQIQLGSNTKIKENEMNFRGPRPSTDQEAMKTVSITAAKLGHRFHKGIIISKEDLFDNKFLRDSAIKATGAIGGEMEAIGAFMALRDASKDLDKSFGLLVAKSICDWGYNKNDNEREKEANQKRAAEIAADVVVSSIESYRFVKKKKLHRKLTKPTPLSQLNLKRSIAQRVAPDNSLLREAYSVRPTTIDQYRLHRYACWARAAGGQLQNRFVNLHLLVDRGVDHAEVRFLQLKQRYKRLKSLMKDYPETDAWILIGDPGAGKSTILQHYEMTCAAEGIRDNSKELCVYQRLSKYSVEDVDPKKWLSKRWTEQYPDLPGLDELGNSYRIRFLLDGINEVKIDRDSDYRKVVNQWMDWTEEQLTHTTSEAPIFTIRTMNYSVPFALENSKAKFIRLDKWKRSQVKEYIYSTAENPKALWSTIKNNSSLLGFFKLPLNIAQQCEIFNSLGIVANNRAELYSGLTWWRLRRALFRSEIDSHAQLDVLDIRQILNLNYFMDNLLNLPNNGLLISTLDDEAYELHKNGLGASAKVENVAINLTEKNRSSWLNAVQVMNIAEIDLTGDFRFTHHTWQEFFAARKLRSDKDERPELGLPELEDIDYVLSNLSVGDLLPGPGTSHWEESIKILILLLSDKQQSMWLDYLSEINTPLSARAQLTLQKNHAARQSSDKLVEKLLEISRDQEKDVRQRIEAGLLLGALGDPRYIERKSVEGVKYALPSDKYFVKVDSGKGAAV